MTALMQAAFWKHAEVVRALLAAGVFVETEEGEQVGSLVMRGQAEPKNKLVFNAWGLQGEPTGSFYDALDRIVTLAENENNATCQPDDWEVHPALVTQRELEIFNEPIKRSELLVALERRFQDELLGPELMQGLEWSYQADPKNAVTLSWHLSDNKKPDVTPRPWKFGMAEGGEENIDEGRGSSGMRPGAG